MGCVGKGVVRRAFGEQGHARPWEGFGGLCMRRLACCAQAGGFVCDVRNALPWGESGVALWASCGSECYRLVGYGVPYYAT